MARMCWYRERTHFVKLPRRVTVPVKRKYHIFIFFPMSPLTTLGNCFLGLRMACSASSCSHHGDHATQRLMMIVALRRAMNAVVRSDIGIKSVEINCLTFLTSILTGQSGLAPFFRLYIQTSKTGTCIRYLMVNDVVSSLLWV